MERPRLEIPSAHVLRELLATLTTSRPFRPEKSGAQVLYELMATLDTSRSFRPEWRDLSEKDRVEWTEVFGAVLAHLEKDAEEEEA